MLGAQSFYVGFQIFYRDFDQLLQRGHVNVGEALDVKARLARAVFSQLRQ